MPAIGATDHANLEAKACVELGFLRQLQQPQRDVPHPSLVLSSAWQTKDDFSSVEFSPSFCIAMDILSSLHGVEE